ncbi:MAG TPA: hypothetical protein VJC07_03500 [Candidatus Nanoarchaeia archaeon]|nr:hypothetical protein [Candidatus Nanoarchaeia archaeon]
MPFKICLIGSIPKGDDARKNWTDWKPAYKKKLSKLTDISFVDGDSWKDETKPLQLVGHDAYLIKTSDLIIVNAEVKLGVGTAQEMVIAKYYSRPVVAILPKDTQHRKSNILFDSNLIEDWVHPFILATSDLIVENIDDAVSWIKELKDNPKSKKIKDISIIDEAISSYLNTTKA